MYYGWSTLKKLLYLVRQIAKKVIGVLTYVEGTYPPIRLESAVKSDLVMLKQDGNCEQESTPTPSAPAPIICNNGTIKYGALGNNLFDPNPSAITLGWYIAANNGQVLESQTNFLMPQYIPVVGGEKYVFYGRHKTSDRMSSYNRIAFYSANKTYISTGDYTKDKIGTGTAPSNAAYARLSCNLSGESAATGTPVTYAIIADYNWTFAQAAAEIPYEPFVGGIYTDGTPEQIYVGGKNLNAGEITHQGYDSNGEIITSNNIAGTLTKIPVRYDKTQQVEPGVVDPVLCVSWGGITNGRAAYVSQWEKDGTFRRYGGQANGQRITVNENAEYLNVTVYDPRTDGVEITEDAWIQLEYVRGNATEYQPYTGGTYVNAVNLLGIPNVAGGKDSHDIITGEVHRNVGIKVFDGSESFGKSSAYGTAFYIQSAAGAWGAQKARVICSHYLGLAAASSTTAVDTCFFNASGHFYFRVDDNSDTAAFKAWLTAQYAAGTPVIVIYPLADTQISHVDPQPITLPAGEDVVYWAASVKNKRMTAQYYKIVTNTAGSAIVGSATAG